MEPVIQYAMTSDGVSIAFSTLGEGPPVLILPVLPLSHALVERQRPGMRELLERREADNQARSFDARGLRLSDRGESARAPRAHLRAVVAVLTKLGLQRLA